MKIAVAMSGGVDSSVAAKILKDDGHKVIGLFLKLWSDSSSDCNIEKQNKCCDYEALDDARRVAAKLNIPFYVINASDEFKKGVVDYFLNEYKNLRTPNPCVVCNDKIKFGLLLRRVMDIGCDKLATGHYARIEDAEILNPKSEILKKSKSIKTKNYKLFAGIDKTKDQSYMLYHLSRTQLSCVLFPLGETTKYRVRELAVKWNLPVKEKPESQEICFFGDKDYRGFLKRYLSKKYFKPGEIVDRNGNILGEHQGLINYTIGQRKGVEQISNSKFLISNKMSNAQNKNKIPLYVIRFDIKQNQLIVGEDNEVYAKEMIVSDVNWIDPDTISCKLEAESLTVKIRYRHEAIPCRISNIKYQISNKFQNPNSKNNNKTIQQYNSLHVVFAKKQRAITPGQSAVFYVGDEVIGGGIII